jgi:hypothetical protein
VVDRHGLRPGTMADTNLLAPASAYGTTAPIISEPEGRWFKSSPRHHLSWSAPCWPRLLASAGRLLPALLSGFYRLGFGR